VNVDLIFAKFATLLRERESRETPQGGTTEEAHGRARGKGVNFAKITTIY
jgi:hypothetical protein